MVPRRDQEARNGKGKMEKVFELSSDMNTFFLDALASLELVLSLTPSFRHIFLGLQFMRYQLTNYEKIN